MIIILTIIVDEWGFFLSCVQSVKGFVKWFLHIHRVSEHHLRKRPFAKHSRRAGAGSICVTSNLKVTYPGDLFTATKYNSHMRAWRTWYYSVGFLKGWLVSNAVENNNRNRKNVNNNKQTKKKFIANSQTGCFYVCLSLRPSVYLTVL